MAKKPFEVWFQINQDKPEAGQYALLREAENADEAKIMAARDEGKSVADVVKVEQVSQERKHWYFR